MKWHYACALCGTWLNIDWQKRIGSFKCPSCKGAHVPPTPAAQHNAFVDMHDWPQEMEDAVIQQKGDKCIIPGCGKPRETLDHEVAWSKGGKTSVENLQPMCMHHNQSKGDEDYATWLLKLAINPDL